MLHTNLEEVLLFVGAVFLMVFVAHRLVWSLFTLLVPEKFAPSWTSRSIFSRLPLLIQPIFFGLALFYLWNACEISYGFKVALLIVAGMTVVYRYALLD
jgi:hypothetical protein